MSWKLTGAILSVCFLTQGTVLGQGDVEDAKRDDAEVVKKTRPLGDMYEDVEVFRRLLLMRLPREHAGPNFSQLGPKMFGQGLFDKGYLTRAEASGWSTQMQSAAGPASLSKNVALDDGAQVHAAVSLEGVYLKGQGVLFTVTLPPPAGGPLDVSSTTPAKPPNEWERIRSEVRGEKPPASGTAPTRKGPGLAEIILKTMAENGKHFRHLEANDTLTVVVTFRQHGPVAGPLTSSINTGYFEIAPNAAFPKGGGATTPRDYELLGDLHQRQGKLQEAGQAYMTSLKMETATERKIVIAQKLAQIFLSLKNNDAAEKMLILAKSLARKELLKDSGSDKKRPDKSTRLPAKLIISVSKRSIDGVKSYDEFRKAATLEYLPFSSGAK